MVNSSTTVIKNAENIPSSRSIKLKHSSQTRSVSVSPGIPFHSLEDEVSALRARNKALTDTLKLIKEKAEKEEKRLYDLVWFSRNRSRYPNHEARYRIENAEEYRDELAKLKTGEGDFHHGVHTGLLAATRLFKDCADISHINDHQEVTADLLGAFGDHVKKVAKKHAQFPKVEVEKFPQK
ncbi:hypothetical protein ACA910_011003 [Epithemia clementina (nom. ined.)]